MRPRRRTKKRGAKMKVRARDTTRRGRGGGWGGRTRGGSRTRTPRGPGALGRRRRARGGCRSTRSTSPARGRGGREGARSLLAARENDGRLRPRGETGRAVRSRRVVHRAAHLRRLGVVHRRGRHRADATRAGGDDGRRGGWDETGRTVTRDDDEGRPCSFEQVMLISASIVQSGSFRHPAVILCNASEFFLNLRRRSSRRSSPPPWASLLTPSAGSPGNSS